MRRGRHIFVPDGLFQIRMLSGPSTSWWGAPKSAIAELIHTVREGRWQGGIAGLYERVDGKDVCRRTGLVTRRGTEIYWSE